MPRQVIAMLSPEGLQACRMMKDVLTDIVAHKREEVDQYKRTVTPDFLRNQVTRLVEQTGRLRRISMKQSLAQSPTGIIAEFKRRSPSKGWIHQDAQSDLIPPAYEAAGAAALSILTDQPFFGGSLRDIHLARPLVSLPILRKDFIIDEYQLLQARMAQADAVLLIAACLSREECATLMGQAHELGLEVLLEIHSEPELAYVGLGADMVGVNNRNLGTFVTDVQNSFRLAAALQQELARVAVESPIPPLLVSESGISHPDVVRRLRLAGFRGFLMGEAFMKADSPADALRDFINTL